jgi:hypothetical protein
VKQRVAHVEQELTTNSEDPRFLAGFVLIDLGLSVQCFVDRCLSFYLFALLTIVIFALRLAASDLCYLQTFFSKFNVEIIQDM